MISIPKEAPLDKATPLLCTGITVYSPLKFSKVTKGSKVGIAGFGGLGHMALKYAVAMGAQVSVFARNDKKKQMAQKLGATNFYTSVEECKEKFDLIISSIPTQYDLLAYTKLLKYGGEVAIVGIPQKDPQRNLDFGDLVLFSGNHKVYGSWIGGVKETQEMMDFSIKHGIYPEIELVTGQEIDATWDKLLNGQGNFRYVIDMKKSILLSYKDDDYLHVILCASLLHHYSDQDIEALKELLVKFYYQNWVAEQTEPKKQTNCNIIKALKEKQSVENIASIVKQYLDDNNKITQNFREKLKDDHLYEKHKNASKNSWLRPILILVEYFISDDPRPKRIEKNDFHVEHILPQNPDPSSQWVKDFSEEERELYTHSLANLTLLGGTKNAQASNLDFKEKKEIYMGHAVKLGKDKRGREKPFKVMTCYKMTIDIAHKYTEWTPKSLEKRKEELIQIIESVLVL